MYIRKEGNRKGSQWLPFVANQQTLLLADYHDRDVGKNIMVQA